MLNDEKVVNKIRAYDNNYQDTGTYVYALIEGGLKKKTNIWVIYVLIFIIGFIVGFFTESSALSGAIIGGTVGALMSLANDYCVMIPEEAVLVIYSFNKMGAKIIGKIEVSYQDIELTKIKKRSIWNTLKVKLGEKDLKIVISEKTLGLKNQGENAKRLIEKIKEK